MGNKKSINTDKTFESNKLRFQGYNQRQFAKTEKKILRLTGIESAKLQVRNIVIDNDGNYIRTLIIDNIGKDTIVFLHGLGAGGVLYWKIMADLAKNYTLMFVDTIGMGGSSRPIKPKISDVNIAEKYLTQWLEMWRQKMDISNFILIGHSFGGYIATLYTQFYQQHIKKLILLSPIGFTKKNNNYITKFEGIAFPRYFTYYSSILWKYNINPIDNICKLGDNQIRNTVNILVDQYKNDKLSTLTENECQLLGEYFYQTIFKQGSTEYLLFTCFDNYLCVNKPIDIDSISVPISFIFGDNDWTDIQTCLQITQERKKKYSKYNCIYILEKCSHQLQWDNPQQLSDMIIYDIESTFRQKKL